MEAARFAPGARSVISGVRADDSVAGVEGDVEGTRIEPREPGRAPGPGLPPRPLLIVAPPGGRRDGLLGRGGWGVPQVPRHRCGARQRRRRAWSALLVDHRPLLPQVKAGASPRR